MNYHRPVLGAELLGRFPNPRRVVDGTLGDGGHAALFRGQGARVLGIDRDPEALERTRARLGSDGIEYRSGNSFEASVLHAIGDFRPDLILLDLGVSSRQLDQDALGFTFRPGAPLDMRLARAGRTAAEALNHEPEAVLAGWFADYGDEPKARRLAAEIIRRRRNRPLATSDDLVNAIRAALGRSSGPGDFARLFQAVRIGLNDELGGLEQALPRLRNALAAGGALAVISYHSGEDRLVKNTFREWSRSCVCPPSFPICRCRGRPLGRVVTKHPVTPGPEEVAVNPRARSAKLRIFEVAADGPAEG